LGRTFGIESERQSQVLYVAVVLLELDETGVELRVERAEVIEVSAGEGEKKKGGRRRHSAGSTLRQARVSDERLPSEPFVDEESGERDVRKDPFVQTIEVKDESEGDRVSASSFVGKEGRKNVWYARLAQNPSQELEPVELMRLGRVLCGRREKFVLGRDAPKSSLGVEYLIGQRGKEFLEDASSVDTGFGGLGERVEEGDGDGALEAGAEGIEMGVSARISERKASVSAVGCERGILAKRRSKRTRLQQLDLDGW
jgi:hypothetical protein